MVARATQDSIDLGWSDPALPDTVQSSEQPAAPLDSLDDDEPTRVATSAAAIVIPAAHVAIDVASTLPAGSAALEVSAVVTEALDDSDIHDEGARVTEPGLAPPPPTSSEMAAPDASAAVRETPVAAAEPALVESGVEARPPETIPPPPVATPAVAIPPSQVATPAVSIPPLQAAMPAVSIPPPPIAPAFFTPASLAPTAVDWNELASPSLLATMKRTRPTSAWTGVGLFIAALTLAGGIGIGRSMNPPMLPPVAVPASLTASVAAGSPSPSTPAGTTQPPAAPVAPSKPPPPFDAKAARAVLDDAANAAKTCRATGDPKGTIQTTVTFASAGKVSNVAINSSRYAGTKTARCITERLSQARVSEFSGFPEALKKLVTVH
jgi:hypothetical protein